MIQSQVPELADGGYWYVVEAEPELEDAPGWKFPAIPGGACAWYAEIEGTMYCVLRSPSLIVGLASYSVPASQVVPGDEKPFARLGGK